ncbi:DUF2231 domain-containing protein [Jiangella rhizosphaerae]|nr:DUF2231 domain-containing protein [Jiangella rhizosphaerae]
MTDDTALTPQHDDAVRGGSPPWAVRLARRLEDDPAADRYDGPLRALSGALLSSPWSRRLLHGDWLGHAVHPLLTDVPVGAWTSAALLDLSGRSELRPAARFLVGAGLVAAVPTAVTGVAEWGRTEGGTRRVGVIHAASNTTALVLYSGSFAARRAGRHRLGVLLGLGGIAAASAGGFLGGHLAIARKVGSRHPVFDRPAPV